MFAQNSMPMVHKWEVKKNFIQPEQARRVGEQALLLSMLDETRLRHFEKVDDFPQQIALGRVLSEASEDRFRINADELQDLSKLHDKAVEEGYGANLLSIRRLDVGSDHTGREIFPGTHLTVNCIGEAALRVYEHVGPLSEVPPEVTLEPGDAYITHNPIRDKPATHLRNLSSHHEHISVTITQI